MDCADQFSSGDQSNTCDFSSDCLNHVGFAFGGGSDGHATAQVSQTNNCIRNSSCSNFAIVGSQSNHCFNGSTCVTKGLGDMQTACANGAKCDNSGENTNVVSNNANCNSGGDNSTTFCQPGRMLTVHNP